MTDVRLAFAQAAETLVGSRFCLHGRRAASGLDCVGVVVAALRLIGWSPKDARGYALRNSDYAPYLDLIARAGFVRCAGNPKAGDLIGTQPGPGQLHLMIAVTVGGFVHAHAGLGRVVRTPGPIREPIVGQWHLIPN